MFVSHTEGDGHRREDLTGLKGFSYHSISGGTVVPPPSPRAKILLRKGKESWQVNLRKWNARSRGQFSYQAFVLCK